MFKITSTIKNGGVWDEKNNRLLTFENGVLETNDPIIVEKCRAIEAFTITEMKAPAAGKTKT